MAAKTCPRSTRLEQAAASAGRTLSAFQSNVEGELIDAVHAARLEQTQAIIINPAGFTHTSVSLRDALALLPFHLSRFICQTFTHGAFPAPQFFLDLAIGVISGLGSAGYDHALQFLLNRNH